MRTCTPRCSYAHRQLVHLPGQLHFESSDTSYGHKRGGSPLAKAHSYHSCTSAEPLCSNRAQLPDGATERVRAQALHSHAHAPPSKLPYKLCIRLCSISGAWAPLLQLLLLLLPQGSCCVWARARARMGQALQGHGFLQSGRAAQLAPLDPSGKAPAAVIAAQLHKKVPSQRRTQPRVLNGLHAPLLAAAHDFCAHPHAHTHARGQGHAQARIREAHAKGAGAHACE